MPASKRYHTAGLFRRVLIGANYRKVWGTPVRMPVFDLKATGMRMGALGGGQQTKSLRLKDAAGREWVLRTVDKDVTMAMPEKLRGTLAQRVVQDLISAANPYAPLVVAKLAAAVGVPAPDPQLYFVPDDPAFSPHQKLFANRICYLELRDPTIDGSESENSEYLQKQLSAANNVRIHQQEVLQARLLDMLIADWDRHADQWRWGVMDSGGAHTFYAIPRDRDQAFFHAGGLIPRVGKAVAMQHLNWFKKNMRGLSKLNYKSRDFDRLYLNELDSKQWEAGIRQFVGTLRNGVIDTAVGRLPPPVYQQGGAAIAAKLKSRRSSMLRPVMNYYRSLAREVQVWGSREAELFEVSNSDGRLLVQVWALDKSGNRSVVRYRRLFDATETKRVHLESLGGPDRFQIQSLPDRSPKIHIYSGGAESQVFISHSLMRRVQVHSQTDASAATTGESTVEN